MPFPSTFARVLLDPFHSSDHCYIFVIILSGPPRLFDPFVARNIASVATAAHNVLGRPTSSYKSPLNGVQQLPVCKFPDQWGFSPSNFPFVQTFFPRSMGKQNSCVVSQPSAIPRSMGLSVLFSILLSTILLQASDSNSLGSLAIILSPINGAISDRGTLDSIVHLNCFSY